MKAKMDEIDEIWAIYKRNLGQNSRWNVNLPLQINFGHWIKNWEQSGNWIAILPLESHLGRRINTGVIWAVKSRCMKEGKYRQKISDLSPIYRQYFGNICGNISPLIFLHEISCRPFPIRDILAIYRWYIPTFSSLLMKYWNKVACPNLTHLMM